MKLAKPDPILPAPIPPRTYWDDRFTAKEVGQNITFEINAHESCSFPRSQLLRWQGGVEAFDSVSLGKRVNKRYLEFEFPAAIILVLTDHPLTLIKLILEGKISILVRGEAFASAPATPIPMIEYLQTKLPLVASSQTYSGPGWIYTGQIILTKKE